MATSPRESTLSPPAASEAAAVSVVASDEVGRRRLATLLEGAGMRVVAQVASARDLDPAQARGLVVTTEAPADVRRRLPAARIVAVVARGTPSRRLLLEGADGVVNDDDGYAVTAAATAVAAGLVVTPRDGRSSRNGLTGREKQILAMIVLGFSNRAISQQLHVTESTVKSHLSSAFRKLRVRSRNEAAALLMDAQNGLGLGILALSEES